MADQDEILAAAAASSEKVWAGHAGYDPGKRSVEQAFPPALADWQGA